MQSKLFAAPITVLAVWVGTLLVFAPATGADPASRAGDLPASAESPVVAHPTSEDFLEPRPPGTRKMGFGPPPPGYYRIRGEAVPGWQAEDLLETRGSVLGWQPLGPRPILSEFWSGNDDASGRVVGIATHPTDPLTAYIASASGGVWKTTNGGGDWTPLTDELSNLNHGCIVLDPADAEVVFAGTGEYTTASDGDGLFRSIDGGATWQQVGTAGEVGDTCSRVVIDPTDSDIVHVSGARGYVRTLDGGTNWSLLSSGRASDLAMDAGDPLRLYLGRHGDGVYRSLDGGDTWARLGGGLPSGNISRVLVTTAPSRAGRVYATLVNGSAGLRGLYSSDDGGDTWTLLANTPNFPSPQGWYDAFLGVDPQDEDLLYAGGVFPSYAPAGVIRSTDGGASWTDVTLGVLGGQLHPDQHTVAFGADGAVWVGNDGGVWRSLDGGLTWLNTNSNLTVTQNYNIALHPQDSLQMIGGTQDNGTVERTGEDPWPQILAGDGGFAAYDRADPTRRYATYVRLSVYRLDSSGVSDITGPWSSDRRGFIAPLVIDPSDSKTLLGGTYRVWRSQNASGFADWSAISGDVSGGGSAVLTAIAVAPNDSQSVYTGSSSGTVYATDGGLWGNRSAGLPSAPVSDIVIHPLDPTLAYAGFVTDSGPRLLRTTDRGLSWSDVTGGLPAGVSVRALEIDWRADPPLLVVGTGVGVYHSEDGGGTWTKDGADLPNVNIGDLQLDTTRDRVVVGTYGRGAWVGEVTELLGRSVLFSGGFENGDFTGWSAVVGQ